jgi:hypothetical protein
MAIAVLRFLVLCAAFLGSEDWAGQGSWSVRMRVL